MPTCLAASTRCGSGSIRTGLANMRIAPTEVIQAIQQENVQAAAGKIGGRPVPHGQDFELPITVKGRLEKAAEFEEIIVRRNDDGSIVRLRDVARVELSSENFETASYIDGKPAGGDLGLSVRRRQRSGSSSARSARRWSDSRRAFRKGSTTRSSTTRPSMFDENISEVEQTFVESFVLVMVVVFVFLQGFRRDDHSDAGDPRRRWSRTFAVMAAFGFSINSLTLCGLVLAIGLVVDDAIIVVENVEKFFSEGLRPLEATRAAMAEITTPIVTITLVLAAVFVPVAFMPGMTGRLYNQFAMTIVFSFVFSAFNSLIVQPGDVAAVLARKARRDEVLFVPLVQRGIKLGGEFVRRGARVTAPDIGGRLSCLRSLLLGLTGWLIVRTAQGVHPDRRPGLRDLSWSRLPTERAARRLRRS